MWLGEVKMGEYRVGLKQISCEDIDDRYLLVFPSLFSHTMTLRACDVRCLLACVRPMISQRKKGQNEKQVLHADCTF